MKLIEPTQHVHKYILKTQKVLIHKYRSEDGYTRAVETRGYDLLKQWVCGCGRIQTYDLERHLL